MVVMLAFFTICSGGFSWFSNIIETDDVMAGTAMHR